MKLQNLRSRSILLAILSVMLALVLVGRLYYLQILRGEDFTQSFEESVTRTVSIPARRGRILDRNGAVIADTAASLNVTIVDNTGNTREENDRLNSIILKTLQILDQNGEETEGDFGISWDGSGYVFDYDGFEHLRFLADVYGYPLTDTLSEEERAASAEDVLLMLADRYRISRDLNTPDKAFLFLNTVVTRYRLALNAFQKYIPTVLARNVGSGTADAIVADSSLDGVSIANDYKRVYNDSLYLSSVTGYISLVSAQELEEYGDLYNSGDYIGKVGIEASMEETLRGKNGRREISVDNLGREQNEISYVRPEEGNDVWLTIDSELQKNIYKILEMNMRNIILSKLTDEVNSFEITAETDGSDILIPAADVYGSLLSYKIDRDHFSAEDASDSERQMQGILNAYLESVKEGIRSELQVGRTPFGALTAEYQGYASYISRALFDRGVIDAFAHHKMIYESAKYHNVVFVGYDKDGKAVHANMRGTGSESTFKGNAEGSIPEYSFHWSGVSEKLYLFEAPIDMLSFISMNQDNWRTHSYAAACCTSDRVLFQMLEDHPNISHVFLCYDNDGPGQKAGHVHPQRCGDQIQK